jgi:multidrug efflux pump subunit AcrA (membrane-fusion protein)
MQQHLDVVSAQLVHFFSFSWVVPVRLRFDNQAEILRPNMFARVTIYGAEPPEALQRAGVEAPTVL